MMVDYDQSTKLFNVCRTKWDLPALITLNAQTLSIDDIHDLQATVGVHDVSAINVREVRLNNTWIMVVLHWCTTCI